MTLQDEFGRRLSWFHEGLRRGEKYGYKGKYAEAYASGYTEGMAEIATQKPHDDSDGGFIGSPEAQYRSVREAGKVRQA